MGEVPADGEGPAVLLYTSGTTAAPKAAVLRHRHLTSYVIGTVEFAGAGPDEAVLVSVPPYHVAGLANLLSNLYLGRRIVYLAQFDAAGLGRRPCGGEAITNAMVVPTMLARICDVLDADGAGLPSLRALSYGGARTPATVLQRVMALLPDVDLTNAYGLTETSSTIAVLGPDDHRAARDGDPAATARLSSAGRVLPTVEVEVRGGLGEPLPAGEPGEIWVRGEQVSGEYAGREAPARRRRAGSRPGTAAGSTPTATCSSRAAATTRSSGAARTSPRPRSRRCCCSTPTSPSARSSASPTTSGASASPRWWWLRPGATVDAATSRRSPAGRCGARRRPRSSPSPTPCPFTETGKLLRRVVQADLLATS